jgi:hypothetical protein
MKRFSELSIPVCLPTLVPPRLPTGRPGRRIEPPIPPTHQPRKPCRVG